MHNRLLDPEPDMPDHIGFDPKHIFNVEGMVIVITGGGTGSILLTQCCYPCLLSSRYWPYDGNGARAQRRDGVYHWTTARGSRESCERKQCQYKTPPFSSELAARLVYIRNTER
jgi:hypothetical protein